MPLWYKSYFEQKTFEFPKSPICLKAEVPKRTQKIPVVTNSLSGSNQERLTLITRGEESPHRP